MATAYYNENDPRKAAWLRELINKKLINKGFVDERDIRDVIPAEILGYDRTHFFAGIGVWDHALKLAGWGKRSVWTGSCPCQPFSAAGRREGFADERHLWPAWFHIISQCKPDVVFGEQVESRDGKAWLDLVWTDLEALGYAVGAVVFPAASVGAPHGRHRIYWVADAQGAGGWPDPGTVRSGEIERIRSEERQDERGAGQQTGRIGDSVSVGGLAKPSRVRPGETSLGRGDCTGKVEGRVIVPGRYGDTGVLADSGSEGREQERADRIRGRLGSGPEKLDKRPEYGGPCGDEDRPGPTAGFWGNADWIKCRDVDTRSGAFRWRAVEPGSFPLVDGSPARVVRLRGYGDGIVAQQAEAFIRAYIDLISRKRGGK